MANDREVKSITDKLVELAELTKVSSAGLSLSLVKKGPSNEELESIRSLALEIRTYLNNLQMRIRLSAVDSDSMRVPATATALINLKNSIRQLASVLESSSDWSLRDLANEITALLALIEQFIASLEINENELALKNAPSDEMEHSYGWGR